MGVFKHLVGAAQEKTVTVEPSDRLLTPANAMTAARPILAVKAARMLMSGEKGVWPVVGIMAATDMEGSVARAIDDRWPDSGLGTSKHGAAGDKYADAAALLTVSGAALLAPRISLPGKMAVGTILAQEGYKIIWASVRAAQYARETGKLLDLPVTMQGKEAMAEKFVGLGSAICTGDTDNPLLRASFGAAALAFAGIGSLRGEFVRQDYEQKFNRLMQEHDHQVSKLPEMDLSFLQEQQSA